ncbi:hypothetical protein [Bradyrhizobium sp. BWC-3-1]|uniref:hypothetical protein n=1 Tax=Bradyrhizobium sp. BWC-3-1 TaxID=3080012 RepID=UPI00293E6878|nr:hypothetical protein [Bradyrhizobium sp. BWC-3-1]WOH55345.1 hypothetical protein RX329_23845 [Bradyrhizobium sp. BWC-3-1]
MRYKVFVVHRTRQVICAAKLDCIDEQAARRRAERFVASTTWSFGKVIGVLLLFKVNIERKSVQPPCLE